MASDLPHNDDASPTEEIYLELRELESAARESSNVEPELAPVVAEDDPTGLKARMARLRAILADRGVEPPS